MRADIPSCSSTSGFLYFDIEADVARFLLERMNTNGASQLLPSMIQDSKATFEVWSRDQQDQWTRFQEAQVAAGSRGVQKVLKPSKGLTPGYVTHDRCPGT
jgi:hypothetical protein